MAIYLDDTESHEALHIIRQARQRQPLLRCLCVALAQIAMATEAPNRTFHSAPKTSRRPNQSGAAAASASHHSLSPRYSFCQLPKPTRWAMHAIAGFVWPGLVVAGISGRPSYPPSVCVYSIYSTILQLVLATTMASTSYRCCTCRSDARTSSRYCMFSSLSDSSFYTYYYYRFLYAIIHYIII